MKILFIADSASIHTKRWLNYFSRKGHAVSVITFNSHQPNSGLDSDIRVYDLSSGFTGRLSHTAFMPLRLIHHYRKCKKIIDSEKPDFLHAHSVHYNGWIGAFSKYRPLILTGWGSDIHTSPKKFKGYSVLTQFALKRADLLTAGSDYLGQIMLQLGAEPSKLKTIYFGVDTQIMRRLLPEELKQVREKLELPNRPVIFSPRLLRPLYNIHILVEAMPKVVQQNPKAIFVVCETGAIPEYLEMIKRRMAELNISKSVRFVKDLNSAEMARFYNISDITISIPNNDSAGSSIWEAMACGSIPSVSDLPAYKEYFRSGIHGHVLSEISADALANRINETLALSEAMDTIRKTNYTEVKKFAIDSTMSQMNELYARLLEEKSIGKSPHGTAPVTA